jgi:hypothetical protein
VWRWVLAGSLAACGRLDFDVAGDAPDNADPSLIAHYRFDDDPNDGVLDSSGRGHDGTCVASCPVLEPGHIGGAYQFNGTTDIIAVVDAIDLRPAALTAAVWFSRPAQEIDCLVQKLYGTNTQDSFQLIARDTGELQVCTATISADTCDNSGPNFVTSQQWHHLAVVETGTTHQAYADGQLVFAAPATIVYDDGRVLIGGDLDFGTPVCQTQGLIDDVRIYNRALMQPELAALAAQ